MLVGKQQKQFWELDLYCNPHIHSLFTLISWGVKFLKVLNVNTNTVWMGFLLSCVNLTIWLLLAKIISYSLANFCQGSNRILATLNTSSYMKTIKFIFICYALRARKLVVIEGARFPRIKVVHIYVWITHTNIKQKNVLS